jgi:hypothetical protein
LLGKGRQGASFRPGVASVLQQTKRAPPIMDGMGRTVAQGGSRFPPENEYLHLRSFEHPAMRGAGASA